MFLGVPSYITIERYNVDGHGFCKTYDVFTSDRIPAEMDIDLASEYIVKIDGVNKTDFKGTDNNRRYITRLYFDFILLQFKCLESILAIKELH